MKTEKAGSRLVVIDVVMLAFGSGIALSPLTDVYAGRQWLVAAAAGLMLGSGAILLSRALRWGPFLTALLLVSGALVVGPAAAAPQLAVARVLPSLDALRMLVTGVVESWRTVLTLPVPLGADHGELVVPFLITLVGSSAAALLLWRTRLAGAAALPVAAMFVASAAFGARETDLPVVRGLALVVVLLLWNRWRALRHVRTSWIRRVALGTSVLAVAGVAGWALTAAVAGPDSREVLRDHVEPPLAELRFKSPLARYRDFYKSPNKESVLFRFEGLPAGDAEIRLASMDTFDGIVWNVATEDLRTGTSAFRPAPAATGAGTVSVQVEKYTGPWVPTIGEAVGVTLTRDAGGGDRELLLNTSTGAVAEYGDVREGDTFEIAWQPRRAPSNALLTAEVDRDVPLMPMDFPAIEKLDALAQEWVSSATGSSGFDKLQALEKGLRLGFFNDGVDPRAAGYSAPGHGARRLADLVADPDRMVGNDEQYASAMAYAAQRLGMPARVVLGFEKPRANGTVTGDDIAAWVEVPFTEFGWVRFDPTPDEDRTPPPEQDSPDDIPQPYVVQPPVLPQEPAMLQGVPPEGAGRDLAEKIWDVILAILDVLWSALKVAVLLSPIWLILLVKRLRRRRRRNADDPLVRLSGGWREITDSARDLGTSIPFGRTRHESGVVLATRFPDSEAVALAAVADRHVFGPGAPSDREITDYWADVETVVARMRQATPRWRRVLAAVSPASIPWRDGAASVVRRTRLAGERALASQPVQRLVVTARRASRRSPQERNRT